MKRATLRPIRLARRGLRSMADRRTFTPPADAPGFRLPVLPDRRVLAVATPAKNRIDAYAGSPSRTPVFSGFCRLLNSQPRALRGFPYPFTFDSVRCHA
jgi:hypothetical protein